MNKKLYISGILTLISFLVMRITPYFEGYTFDKFWFVTMGVLPIGLISFLIFIISILMWFIIMDNKKQNLIIIGLFPILISTLIVIPFPSYVDGMHKAILNSLSKNEFTGFAIEVKLNKHQKQDQLIQAFKARHPKLFELSDHTPRIDIRKDYISVSYGSALVKHWGYLVSDLKEFPIKHIPDNMYKKVYDGVWVYHDIW